MKMEVYSKKDGAVIYDDAVSLILSVEDGPEVKTFVIRELGRGRIYVIMRGDNSEVYLEALTGRLTVRPHRADSVTVRRKEWNERR